MRFKLQKPKEMVNLVKYLLLIFIQISSLLLVECDDDNNKNNSNITIANSISAITFTNETYIGYLSENVIAITAETVEEASATYLDTSVPVSTSYYVKRRRVRNNRYYRELTNSTTTHYETTPDSIFVRFVDYLKPSLFVQIKNNNNNINIDYFCSKIKSTDLNLQLTGDDEITRSSSSSSQLHRLFSIDDASFICNSMSLSLTNEMGCLCNLQIHLIDDAARYHINREAKSLYSLQLSSKVMNNAATSRIRVRILDDNDLEPMFDPSEYNILLTEQSNNNNNISTTPFSIIGRVHAVDPDLERNARVRYYLFTNSDTDDTSFEDDVDSKSSFNKSSMNLPRLIKQNFGVNWKTGEIYLKRSLDHLFTTFPSSLSSFEYEFEVKAIDTGLKLYLANRLLEKMKKSQQNSLKEDEKVESTFNEQLISAGKLAIDTFTDKQLKFGMGNNLSPFSEKMSFESAFVTVTLQRSSSHSATILKDGRIRRIQEIFDNKNVQLTSNSLNSNRKMNKVINYATLTVQLNGNNNQEWSKKRIASLTLNHLTIRSGDVNNEIKDFIKFKLQPVLSSLNDDQAQIKFKLSFEITDRFNDFKRYLTSKVANHASNYLFSIFYCNVLNNGDDCVVLYSFNFRISDFVQSISSNCAVETNTNNNDILKFKVIQPIEPQSTTILTKLPSHFESHSICSRFEGLNLFHNRFQLIRVDDISVDEKSSSMRFVVNQTTGIIELIQYKQRTNELNSSPFLFQLQVETSLWFNDSNIKVQRSTGLKIEIDNKDDQRLDTLPIMVRFENRNRLESSQLFTTHIIRLTNEPEKIIHRIEVTNRHMTHQILYCVTTNDGKVFSRINLSQCPFKIHANGNIYSPNETIQRGLRIDLLIKTGQQLESFDQVYHNSTSTFKHFIIINDKATKTLKDDKNGIDFERKNCSLVIKQKQGPFIYSSTTQNDKEATTKRTNSLLLVDLGLNDPACGHQQEVFLIKNYTYCKNRYKFDLNIEANELGLDKGCFHIDTSRVYFTCQWPKIQQKKSQLINKNNRNNKNSLNVNNQPIYSIFSGREFFFVHFF
jgi:uncharacterized protein YwbE